MVDYSRAQTSKAAKDSFNSTVVSLMDAIQKLKDEYNKEWEEVEELRKGYTSIIKSVKPILNENNVKLDLNIDRCNHDELIEEFSKVATTLPFKSREDIEVAIVRICSRYTQIQEKAKKLDTFNEQLSKFFLPEKDYDKEAVISYEDIKRNRQEKVETIAKKEEIPARESRVKNVDYDLEEVESVTKADENLLESLDELVAEEKASNTPNIIEESDIVYIESDEEEFSFDDAFDNLFDEDRNEDNDDASLMEEFLKTKEDVLPEEANYQTYELKENQTLAEIVDYVYEGKVSWYDIYLYGNNQGMIDRKCAELDVTLDDAAYTPGILSGINIEYPKNFVTYESIKKQENKSSGNVVAYESVNKQEDKGPARRAA